MFKRGDGRLAKVLEDQVFVLKTGDWTAPIRTRPGYLILKVTQHTAGGIPPMSAVDQQVQQAMYEAAMQPALRTYLTDLREKAYIDIAPGFVDTGASPEADQAGVCRGNDPRAEEESCAERAVECGPRGGGGGCREESRPGGWDSRLDQCRGAKEFDCECKDSGNRGGQEAEEDQAREDPLRADAAQRASCLA